MTKRARAAEELNGIEVEKTEAFLQGDKGQ